MNCCCMETDGWRLFKTNSTCVFQWKNLLKPYWVNYQYGSADESFLRWVLAESMRISPSVGHRKHYHVFIFFSHWMQQKTVSSETCLCFCFGGMFVLMPRRDRETKCAFLCYHGHV